MKKTSLLLLSLLLSLCVSGQTERKYSTYYYQRATLFEQLPVNADDILFVGNSITDGGEWGELFQNPRVKNRGISGDTTWGVYDRLSVLTQGKPAQIFLLIGINNVPQGESADSPCCRSTADCEENQRRISPYRNLGTECASGYSEIQDV